MRGSKASCISMDRLSKKKHSLCSDGFDRCLSKLPDNLLLRILSLLQMKDRVRTGCLSTRWKNLWKPISNIDFTQTNMHKTPELIAAIDKTLSYHDVLQSLSFKEILGISGSPSVSVTDLTFETEFWKCNLSGLVYVLRDFSKLEVLTINVMRNHDNKSGDFYKEEKSGINAYWKPDDSSVLGLQQHLKTVKINGFLGSLDTSAEFETTTESILNARDTEFVFVKFLLRNLTELETMIITITEELDNFPALKKLDILSQLSSRLLAFSKSSRKAQILINPDQLTDA
ncbi:putative F-box/LRR-repeat protein At4g13960 isoform X3 [Dioscorea cayenensis subsp. rotundata]|uniref:F-box/LRR-repeat protein At4g13960 isoform X3 n=1 Tax=Dioscorea cayennensis subsp. rotundata TaxID=55577 RepID=A0AB40D462_DIOCR|nr:putative F-box/LRR-repeat protein At4g13960 isoform X3 [Dioscorea cayenensis subsp. rotundata]